MVEPGSRRPLCQGNTSVTHGALTASLPPAGTEGGTMASRGTFASRAEDISPTPRRHRFRHRSSIPVR